MHVPSSSAPRRIARALGAVAALAALGLVGGAQAQPPARGCSVTANPLSFGVYNPLSNTPVTLDTSAVIDCSSSVKFMTVTLTSSASSAAGFRQMRSSNDALAYNIYLDPQRTQVWSEGASLTYDMEKRGNLALMLHGLVPARQNVSVGSYRDTLTLTIVTP